MKGERRRRFGVSIPESIARSLDALARVLGRDRSSLVAEALRTYIHDHEHLLVEHKCSGVVVAWSAKGKTGGDLRSVIEEYMDMVKGHLHAHVDGYCVDVLVVEGVSSTITELVKRIMELGGCTVRYIPLGEVEPSGECVERGHAPPRRGS